MKTVLVIIMAMALFALSAGVALADGPAINAGNGDGICDSICGGDGVCDGTGPQGNSLDSKDADSQGGPPPNAGDCIPDGPGW